MDVLLVDVNLQAAEKAAKSVAERNPNVKVAAFKADVSKEAEVKAAVDKAVELFGRLDIMVCVYLFLLLLPRLLYHRPVLRARAPRIQGARARSSALHANPLTRRAVRRGYVLLLLLARPVSSTTRARAQPCARLPVPCRAWGAERGAIPPPSFPSAT